MQERRCSFGAGPFKQPFSSATLLPRFTHVNRFGLPPYTLIFGEPFPDASIVVPFGCGALVLLDKDGREKFQSRCALMVFVHYATSHPMYTYAFYSPRTKCIVSRQDAIFLVNHFPMRMARTAAGFPDPQNDLSFQTWAQDEPLPVYDDHVKGTPLTDTYFASSV
jgi:hypothetical protein